MKGVIALAVALPAMILAYKFVIARGVVAGVNFAQKRKLKRKVAELEAEREAIREIAQNGQGFDPTAELIINRLGDQQKERRT